ncbi:uncharacterized protein [Anabrus simplex]|uniref:uncharacterized protein n=1 Tax=Anabrus simplex TaxID=316456 RepID=UPI0035A282BA
MGADESWVDAYRQEHECDEHWQLRRSFLLTHRDRFPEERLVCLAQVFTNVEFLGCRYPEKTMKLIAELSQEVAADYREKQKTRLQRTFVQASDAAGAKVKGLKRPQDQTSEHPSPSSVNNAAPKKDNSNSSSAPKSDCTPAKNRKFTNFVAASSEPTEESPDCQIILEKSSSMQASSESSKIKPSENIQENISKGAFASSQHESLDSKMPQSIKMSNIVSGSADSPNSVPKKESPNGGPVKNSNFPQNLQASSSARFQDTKPNPAAFSPPAVPFSTGSSSQPQDNNSVPPLTSLFERRVQNNSKSAQPSTSVSERTFTTPSGDVKPLSFSHYGGVRTYHIDRPTNNVNESADDDVMEVDPDEEDPDNPRPNKADVSAAFNAINSSPFGRLVLIEMTEQNDGPAQIIHRSAFGCQIPTNFLYERLPGGKTCCKLYVNRNIVAQGIEHNNKSAKDAACVKALQKLQEHCFTLKIKAKILTDGTTIEKEDPAASTENQTIGEENIGNKLLRLMGWSGGGLGKDKQGIEEPVSVAQRVNRSGLGIQQSQGSDARAFAVKMTRILKDFAAQNTDRDLVFSSDFTKPERKKMHEIAQRFNLKTKSYGKDNERYLVVSQKFSVMRIVEKMLHCGGSSEKYELVPPTSLKLFKDR